MMLKIIIERSAEKIPLSGITALTQDRIVILNDEHHAKKTFFQSYWQGRDK